MKKLEKIIPQHYEEFTENLIHIPEALSGWHKHIKSLFGTLFGPVGDLLATRLQLSRVVCLCAGLWRKA